MHDQLLETLQSVANVRLVAALRDPRLSFPSDKDLRVFIPDIHLISEKRRIRGRFRYATNYPDLLERVAIALRRLRGGLAASEAMTVYQVGDFLDLWREAPDTSGDVSAASAIEDDHEDLVAALTHKNLQAHFLLGNHDLELYKWSSYSAWERRYFIPDHGPPPTVILLHGDVFDWLEKYGPDALQEIFVYLFSPYVPPANYRLGVMRDFVKRAHGKKAYKNFIQASEPVPSGQLRPASGDVPAKWNVQEKGVAPEENLKFLDSAFAYCEQANRTFNLALSVAVIGHTHHARIATREEPDGRLFALIDCGAWIEECTAEGEDDPMPSAQVAALCCNEARIYQLAPKS